jgi:hypothetical protein
VNRKNVILVFIAILTLCIAGVAQAQATRTWVSGVGDDVNPCSRTAPCKTFAGAISKTATGGEISVLDPGGFGALTITKAITINGHGPLASILASGTTGIIVNAPSTANVVLRDLDINGAGTGIDGIRILNGAKIVIENTRIQGFTQQGIEIAPSTAGLVQQVVVHKSEIRNNTQQGILVLPTGTATVKLEVSSSLVSNHGVGGVDVAGNNNSASIFDTVFTNNNPGVQVQLTSSTAFVESCMIANNTTGINSGIGGQTPVIRISRCAIVNNSVAGLSGTGTTVGLSNNMLIGNVAGNAVSSSVAQQ